MAAWEVEFTDEFQEWWDTLDSDTQDAVDVVVGLRRVAILLIGGLKAGDDRWYERHVPTADDLYDDHLREIGEEEARDG